MNEYIKLKKVYNVLLKTYKFILGMMKFNRNLALNNINHQSS